MPAPSFARMFLAAIDRGAFNLPSTLAVGGLMLLFVTLFWGAFFFALLCLVP